jgi:hypothetical protein
MTLRREEIEFPGEAKRYPGRYEVVDALLVRGGTRLPVVVKKMPTGLFERPGRTRSDRAAQVAQALLERGIPTPEPLGVLLVPGESWFVARRVEGAAQIREWFLHRDDPRWPAPRLGIPFEEIVSNLGRLARRMHDSGVFFRDFSDGNLLVTRDGTGSRLWLVDLTRARVSGQPVSLWNRLRDLSRPGLNRAEDRKLLLSSYFDPDPVPRSFEAGLTRFRRRLVFWDDLKRAARPWKREAEE